MNIDKKILVIRLSSIGDILLTTPFLRQTRLKFQQSQIDFVIKKEFAELLQFNSNINNLFEYDLKTGKQGLKNLRQELLANNYDYIFDLHKNFRSVYLRHGHQTSNVYQIKKNKIVQFIYVKCKFNFYKQPLPIAERYLKVGDKVGIEDDNKGLEIFWNDKTKETTDNILRNYGIAENEPFYAIAPGAGFYTKKWPIGYYKDFVKYISEKHKMKITVLGNQKERSEGEALGDFSNVIDFTGKLSLLQSAVVLSRSKALVSNDSGLMHMASATKTPVLAIFGSTVKELGFFPYRSSSIVVENNKVDCRPCSHIGMNKCPKKHFRCMKDISVETLIENFEKLIKN